MNKPFKYAACSHFPLLRACHHDMSHPPSLPLPSYKHGWCVCHLDCTSCSPGIRISSRHVFRRLTAAKVVTCIIMQKSGAPLHTALTLHWDTKTDGTSCVQVGTDTMDPWLDVSVAELFGKLTCWHLRKFEACHVHKQEPSDTIVVSTQKCACSRPLSC